MTAPETEKAMISEKSDVEASLWKDKILWRPERDKRRDSITSLSTYIHIIVIYIYYNILHYKYIIIIYNICIFMSRLISRVMRSKVALVCLPLHLHDGQRAALVAAAALGIS